MYDFSGIRNSLVKIKDHFENQIVEEVKSMDDIGQTFLAQHRAKEHMKIPVEERRRIRMEQSKERQEKRLKVINEKS